MKHNWNELKLEYLSSNDSILDFFRKKGQKMSGAIANKTKGRADEKEIIQNKARIRAEEMLVEKMAKVYLPSQKELGEIHKALLFTVKAKAMSNAQKIRKMPDGTIIIPPDISMHEQRIMWEMIKTEKGEPTSIRDRDDILPEEDEEEKEVVTFYLPDNGREELGNK